MVAGILVIGVGSGFYIGAGLGAGPRDSLMLITAQRTGVRVGIARATIEVAATVVGFALTAIVIGVGSFLLHATLTLWGQFWDVVGMYLFSAFTLSYSLFEIPSGWLGDVKGPRRVLTRIVLWWSAFTMLTGAAVGYRSLIATRFLFGAGEVALRFARLQRRWGPWGLAWWEALLRAADATWLGWLLVLLVVVSDIGARRTVRRALPELLRQVQE